MDANVWNWYAEFRGGLGRRDLGRRGLGRRDLGRRYFNMRKERGLGRGEDDE